MSIRTLLLVALAAWVGGTAVEAGTQPGSDAEGRVILVLAGPGREPVELRRMLAPLWSTREVVLVPQAVETDESRRQAFVRTAAEDTLESDRAAACRLLARRVVREHLSRDRSRPIHTVIALYDGLDAALYLVRSGLVQPRRLVLLDPDPEALSAVKPPEVSARSATSTTVPFVADVFFTQGSLSRLTASSETVRKALSRWGATVRVFAADLRGQPLEVVAREMVWPLKGLRMVEVKPEGLREIQPSDLFRRLGQVDAVFAGEKHDNTVFHEFQLGLLKALDSGRHDLLLSLEMFERDVQPVLDRYLKDQITEAEFLAKSRPWPNYRTDYRPLVEYARAHGVPVLAANVPRRYASQIARKGPDALADLPAAERAFVATEARAASPEYRMRFSGVMQGMDPARLEPMFQAQCLKDDTMAESIHGYLEEHPQIRRVLHVNGSFHSSYGLGTVHGLKQRRPDITTAIVTCMPVENPQAVDLVQAEMLDDYLVFTAEPLPRARRPMPRRHPGMPGPSSSKP